MAMLALTTGLHLVAQMVCFKLHSNKKKNMLTSWVSDLKLFKCINCQKIFQEKPIECNICGIKFLSTESVQMSYDYVSSSHESSNKSSESKKFAFKFVNAVGISKIISKLNNTKALGVDDLGSDVWKKGVISLAGPIARLCNLSISSGIVPDMFKKAIVHPVYKGQGKNPRDPGSYRPIAILPAISKILEMVVREELLEWFKHSNFLPESQFRFLPGKSVDMALIIAQNDLIKAKNEGFVVGAMAFDLSAAFDVLEHSNLLNKLESAGISGVPLMWFSNYLSGRSQRTLWNGKLSTSCSLNRGVPQGSILGPILFLSMIADMPKHLTRNSLYASSRVIGFADDTTVYCKAESIKNL